MRGLHLTIFFFAAFGLSAQIFDTLKLVENELGVTFTTPYVNRYSMLPILVLSFALAVALVRSFQTMTRLNIRRSALSIQMTKKMLLRQEISLEEISRSVSFTKKLILRPREIESRGLSGLFTEVSDYRNAATENIVKAAEHIAHVVTQREEETRARIATESRFSKIVRQLDPALYSFIEKNGADIARGSTNTETRGVIFFDQKGYSTLLENLDPQKTIRLTEITAKWVVQMASRYGARIHNFSGDSYTLEAYPFRDELPEPFATRILSLAWDLVEGTISLNKELFKAGLPEVRFRFGAHVGVASNVNLDFIAPGLSNIVGDTVNLAARLQVLAPPGTAYVSGELIKMAGETFMYRRIPRKYVKGRSGDFEVYELVGRAIGLDQKIS